ncbi:hypothetical protein [Nonomuraea terrae]|nr:hypothetical protein [Nonomuraea terrae]
MEVRESDSLIELFQVIVQTPFEADLKEFGPDNITQVDHGR